MELNVPSDVKNDIDTVVSALLEKFPDNIGKIILFGSYATGKYQPGSDIDIAVVLNELPDAKERRHYKHAVDIERELDLLFCTREQLERNMFVHKWINEQGVVLYEQL
ncbi:MAG: nucleotidyltransferase domain-containing protein [Clostridiales bacterium]|jgi:predicted nucleotidyltransferase|nr:nucleotidyltransferase domain-containing protein [Clostridiales bacterium]